MKENDISQICKTCTTVKNWNENDKTLQKQYSSSGQYAFKSLMVQNKLQKTGYKT